MKKMLIIVITLLVLGNCYAQELKGGFLVSASAGGQNFDADSLKVSLGLLSNVVYSTPKTYHNLAYAWGANSLLMINGWMYTEKKNQDVYVVTGKRLSKSGGYLGIGWEYELKNGNFVALGFVEVGTDWYLFDKPSYRIGLIAPISVSLWKKKLKQ